MKEKIFSLVSLAFLTVGFIVGVAGADKDGPKDLAHATDELIQHVTIAREANEINQPQMIISPSNDEAANKVIVTHQTKLPEKKRN